MADSSIAVTPGSGANIDTRTVSGGDHREVIVLGDDGTTGATVGVTAAGDLQVYNKDVLASGTITTQNLVPAGAATAGSAVASGALNGVSTVLFQVTGTYTGALSVQGTVDGSTWVTLGGTPLLRTSTGAWSATVASAVQDIFAVDVAGYNQVRVTGLAAMTGTATVTMRASAASAVVGIDAALPAGTNQIGGVNVSQVNGVTPLMGNGTTGTGSQRVTIASDNTAFTVNTTPTTPTASAINSAATTNATSVKATAGTVFSVTCSNAGAAAAFVKLYNKASAPAVGTDVPVLTIPVPASGIVQLDLGSQGVRFATGIALAITNLVADSDTTAVAANQVKVLTSYI